MSTQPKKPIVDCYKRLSKELKNIFDEIREGVLITYPSMEITIEHFLFYTLQKSDCMLYKALNCFTNLNTISELCDKIELRLQETTNLVSSYTVYNGLSKDIEFLLSIANAESISMEHKTITSDHLFLAILKENESYRKFFQKKGVSHSIYQKFSKELHEVTTDISTQKESAEYTTIVNNDFNEGFITKLLSGQALEYKPKREVVSNCTDLIKKYINKNNSFVGREEEIKEIENVLGRKFCKNIILVGESGTGKTKLVHGIAHAIANEKSSLNLSKYKIFELNTLELISGTQFRGMFESKFNSLMKELKAIPNAILFIDNIHSVITEKSKNEGDIASHLLNSISNGEISTIVTTTNKGFKSINDIDSTFVSKFQRINIKPLSVEESINVLNSLKPELEKYHSVKYEERTIETCVKLAKRYITTKELPLSAIEVLDESGAFKKVEEENNSPKKQFLQEIKIQENKKNQLIKDDKIDELHVIDGVIEKIKLKIADYDDKKHKPSVNIDDIYNTISKITDIPVARMNISERKALSNIDNILKEHIIGQDEAIHSITQAIKRNKIGLYPNSKPIGSFLCIGSTGCGKTLLAKELAKQIFGDEKYLVRLDMSEYADKTSVNKLIGSSAGYIGYQNGGILTEAIKNKKYAVLLIDEIEKADEEVYNIFLQILDEGFLSDNTGQKVDFKNTIILMTSNVGVKESMLDKGIGFNINGNEQSQKIINKELKNKFPPEFLNRIDEIIFFNKLTDDNLKEIIKLELFKLNKRLNNINFSMIYDDMVLDFILNNIKDKKEYGARPIIRYIQDNIENRITDAIIENDYLEHQFNINIINHDMIIK